MRFQGEFEFCSLLEFHLRDVLSSYLFFTLVAFFMLVLIRLFVGDC